MMKKHGTPREGIPVPLYNLVYHDCVIQPWMMEKNEGDDYMLYALLNGGAPYLIREAAYPNTDGAFEGSNTLAMQKMIKRSNVVCALHEKVGKCEMIRHEMVGNNPMVQKRYFPMEPW